MFQCSGKSCSEVECRVIEKISYDSFVECRSILYLRGEKEYQVGRYYLSSIDEVISLLLNIKNNIEFEKNYNIKYIWGVIQRVQSNNGIYSVNVEGPFTILCSLISPVEVFKQCRPGKGKLNIALRLICDFLEDYIYKLSGVKMISYADPSGDMKIVGPRIFKEFVAPYTIEIINYIKKCNIDVIHICGRMSVSLEDMEYIRVKREVMDSIKPYEEHVLSLNGGKVICHSCVKMLSTNRKIIHIGEII
ncbi:MAG: uroporphyrinogen decarboxylase family protein [Clostridium sp.]